MEEFSSKDLSWEFVTADRCLTKGPCELIYAQNVPTGATTTSILYNGVDANGREIIALNAAVATDVSFSPPVPVYCEHGLYVAKGTAVTGVFVLWRNL
jgi:hypothetical protein